MRCFSGVRFSILGCGSGFVSCVVLFCVTWASLSKPTENRNLVSAIRISRHARRVRMAWVESLPRMIERTQTEEIDRLKSDLKGGLTLAR